MEAGLERLKRIAAYAESKGALILLENLNKEPEDSEVHYLAHTVEEWRYYFERIQSPAFGLSFTANHAHLVPEGIEGFVDALDMRGSSRSGWRTAFATAYEVHLKPGAGDWISATCFGASRARVLKGTTPTPSLRSMTCLPAASTWLRRPGKPESLFELAQVVTRPVACVQFE